MRAERRRALARCPREAQHGLAVTRRLGVVGEPREVDLPPGRAGERGQGAPMERERAVRRQRLLDGDAGDLVAERDGAARRAQHPGGEALLEVAELAACQLLQQPELGPRRRDRNRVEQRAGARAETGGARQHGVADAVGHRGAARRERLGDEERVAGRAAVELLRVDAVQTRERGDRPRRQRREREPGQRRLRQLAERDAQRVVALELVVAVGDRDERRHRRDPACEQAEQVERRLVGPVQVLEHDDRWRAPPQLVEQRGQHVARPGAALDEVGQLAACLGGDVEQRPERPRRVQRLARAREHADGKVGAERVEERRLADPGLSGDEHEPPATALGHSREGARERVELVRPFEQLLPVAPCRNRAEPDARAPPVERRRH